MMKKTDGFTLVELVVGILCAAVVTGAAISVMLMNARINRTVIDANVDQQDTRIITSLVENLASEGGIASVKYIHNTASDKTDWALLDGDESTANSILSYSSKNETISGRDGAVLMSGVLSSSVSISRGVLNGCLLNLSIETKAGQHETSVYCRTSDLEEHGFNVTEDENDNPELTIKTEDPNNDIKVNSTQISSDDGRLAFLSVLASQVGSPGYVLPAPDPSTSYPTYYSRWYNSSWPSTTPWCGCFISWAVAQTSATTSYTPAGFIPFANVDTGWTNFKQASLDYNRSQVATPGDLIFFSWDSDDIKLEHVGVVLYVDTTPGRNYVYTIEGNSSNQVALRRYSRDDSRIVGYGVLTWNSTP